jgi:hypothetical protein
MHGMNIKAPYISIFLEYLEKAKNPASLSTNVYTPIIPALFPKYLTT